jgi:hypothetical protein
MGDSTAAALLHSLAPFPHSPRHIAKKRDEVAIGLDARPLNAARVSIQNRSAESQPVDATTLRAPPGGWEAPARPR